MAAGHALIAGGAIGDPKAVRVGGGLLPRDLAIGGNRLDHDPAAVYRVEFQTGAEACNFPLGTTTRRSSVRRERPPA